MNKVPDHNPRKALGRGLSALLPTRGVAPALAPAVAVSESHYDLPKNFEAFQTLPLDRIIPGSEQPRSNFDPEKLKELADSIRANGVIQPITVCQDASGKFRIIAGERRWRAAKLAGETTIPALVRTADQHERLELALIENLQREDLNPIEIAIAFQRLIDEHKLSHEQIAQRTGKDRSTVTNFLRLLRVTPFVRQGLANGTITMGHARALLSLPTEEVQDELARAIVDRQLSVRMAEMLVKNWIASSHPPPVLKLKDETAEDPNIRAALAEMEAALGTKVRLTRKSNGSGRLEIEFYSADDLDRIYSVVTKQ